MRAAVAFVTFVLIAGCGGSQKPAGAGGSGGGSVASGGAGGGAVVTAGAGSGSSTAAATVPDDRPLTRDDCVAVLGHIVDVGMAEKRKTMPPDQAPNDADAAKARKQVIDAGADECLKMPRPMFDCAMKAQDTAALQACDQ